MCYYQNYIIPCEYWKMIEKETKCIPLLVVRFQNITIYYTAFRVFSKSMLIDLLVSYSTFKFPSFM